MPAFAAILLGIGMGAFLDDIVRSAALLDAVWHAAAWAAILIGLFIPRRLRWPTLALLGAMFIGLGGFDLLESSPRPSWLYWDLGFIAFGALMIIGGWYRSRARPVPRAKPSVERRKRQMRWRPGDRRAYKGVQASP
ncbi:MAG TPA: hypothetical protein VIV54_13575 [Burkholderiales bacterium]